MAGDQLSAEVMVTPECARCGQCLLGVSTPRRVRVEWPLPDSPPLAGQQVRVVISELGLTRACVVLFGLPLLAWLVGICLGNVLFGGSGSGLTGGAALMACVWAIAANGRTLERWFDLGLAVEPPRADSERASGAVERERSGGVG